MFVRDSVVNFLNFEYNVDGVWCVVDVMSLAMMAMDSLNKMNVIMPPVLAPKSRRSDSCWRPR